MFRTTLPVAFLILITVAIAVRCSQAAPAPRIDADVRTTLDNFYRNVAGARELAAKSAGMLVFPSVVKAGIGVGGEYGEGALLIRGRTVGYYNTVSASVGYQLGIQERSIIIIFMTEAALSQFRLTAGWKIGVDGSVAVVTLGAGGAIDTTKIASPVIGFVLNPKGLMYNLTLEGTKITRIKR